MKRLPELARRGAALVLAASMSLSVLTPGAFAADAADLHDHVHLSAENSVDELGNVDLDDEVFNVPEEKAEIFAPEETEEKADEDAGVSDDLALTDPDNPEWLSGGDIALYWKPHGGSCSRDILLEEHAATCTTAQTKKWKCVKNGHFENWWETIGSPLGHMPEQDAQTYTKSATCTEDGVTYKYCGRNNNGTPCTYEYPNTRQTLPATGHTSIVDGVEVTWFPDDEATADVGWITTEATCTEPGRHYRKCETCGTVEEEEGYSDAHPATGHHTNDEKWEKGDNSDIGWVVDQPYPCVAGTKTRTCDTCEDSETVEVPATAEHQLTDWIVTVEAFCETTGTEVQKCTVCEKVINEKTIPAIGHKYNEEDWTDTDPDGFGCMPHTYQAQCVNVNSEGVRCTNVGNKTMPAIRPHKFTRYVTHSDSGLGYDAKTYSYCDYGCGTKDEMKVLSYPAFSAEAAAADYMSDEIAKEAAPRISNAMRATETAVCNATTREEAIQNLDTLYTATKAELIGLTSKYDKYGFVVDEATAEKMLVELKATVDSMKKALESSFLSMDAIKSLVRKTASTAVSSEDQVKKSVQQLVFYPVYNSINTREWNTQPTDSTKVITSDLILKLAKSVVDSDAEWQEFLKSIYGNLIDMLIDYIRNDEEYGKYLNNKLGEELLDELSDLLYNELIEDQAFVEEIRSVVSKALENADYGVNRGWSDEKILANLREDLMKVQDPVEREMLDLSGKMGDMVEKSLANKINGYLPFGDLTSWIGNWVGAFAKDKLTASVSKQTGSVNDTIEKYLKYITCAKHEKVITIIPATCTEPEYTVETCKNCDWQFSKTKTSEPLGHTPMTILGRDATETTDGLTDGIQCSVCGYWIEPQEVIPALTPEYDKWLVQADVTADTVKATGYKDQKALDAAIDAALTKAGFTAADSERFLAQAQTNLDVLKDEYDREPGEGASRILPNDRYPEDGITGMVKIPAQAAGKNCTYYAVQVLTADSHGYSAGDVVVTPLTVTKEGISLKLPVQSVVAIAWKVNE